MRLRREARWIWPILAIVVTGLVCAGYVLSKQRLESPVAERYRLQLEFGEADAVTPGLGAPITVAGVKVGQIDGAELENGRGLVSASIDPKELPRVYEDATAQLVPNTEVTLETGGAATVAALVALLDAIGPAIVMVHSQSGAYGMDVVRRRPERVRALVSIEGDMAPVTPEEVARVVCFLVGPDAAYITGKVLQVDGGQIIAA